MKSILNLRFSILALLCVLVGSCGTFSGSYTDASGNTFTAGVHPSRVADNK